MAYTIQANPDNNDYIDFILDTLGTVSSIKRITTVRLDPDDPDGVIIHFNVYSFPSHAPPPLINDALLQYINGNRKTLILKFKYTDVGTPSTSSAAELFEFIQTLLGTSTSTVVILKITAGMFTADNYSHASLVGKTADTGFMVFGDGGFGGLLEEGTGYGFNSGTGTIQMGSYGGAVALRILIR